MTYRIAAHPAPVKELCRKHGFSDAAFYGWRSKFGGLQMSEAERLQELEAEDAKLKKMLAEAHLGVSGRYDEPA